MADGVQLIGGPSKANTFMDGKLRNGETLDKKTFLLICGETVCTFGRGGTENAYTRAWMTSTGTVKVSR